MLRAMQVAALGLMLLMAAPQSAWAQDHDVDGKALFLKKCAACHQASGMGIRGAFPALKGNALVQGDSLPVILTVLKGRGGMPTFAASMDDEKLASVLSYVRAAWGNQGGVVSLQDVGKVRTESAAPGAVTTPIATNIH